MDLFCFDSLELNTGSMDLHEEEDTPTTLTPYNDCNWSDLHEDLLELILMELGTVADCLRFGSVCVSWRSLLVPHFHPELLHPQLPFLMIPSLPWPQSLPLPPPSPDKLEKETRSFYSLSERRVISEDDLKIKLPHNRYCRGCSYGWIITTGKEDSGFSVELLNPFISINNEYQKIQLPPLTAFPYNPVDEVFHNDYLEKAVLSADPNTTADYVVMAIYSGLGKLAFWKPGNEIWTDIPIEWKGCLDDVIYHHNDGLFYLVNIHGEVMVCDLDHGGGGGGTVRKFAPSPRLGCYGGLKKYLVESLGDLLMVQKYEELNDINEFKVYKLSGEKKKKKNEEEEEVVVIEGPWAAEWERINTLPERMLFVGDNASMSLSASDSDSDSDSIGGKSSGCIYFTDDYVWKSDEGFPDIGIFDLKDKTIGRLHPAGFNDYMSPANTIWVAPTLRCCLRF